MTTKRRNLKRRNLKKRNKTKKKDKKKRKFTSKKYPYKNHSKEKALDNFLKLKAKKKNIFQFFVRYTNR